MSGLGVRELQAISQKSGLTVRTCQELLEKGWVFVNTYGDKVRWELPGSRVRR